MNKTTACKCRLIAAVLIFGTIGVVRRAIPLPSGVIAMARGFIGALFLLALRRRRGARMLTAALKRSLPLLCLSGALIGFNWILLFEAYRYTSVAVATVCYYMAPVFVLLASPLALHEALTVRRGLCVLAALVGMALTSGVLETGFSGLLGAALGLAAAVLYAAVVLMNKGIREVPADDRTLIQLAAAGIALLPYVLLTEDMGALSATPGALALLVLAGILHTGVAYALYFGSMEGLPAQTVALMSYIDPVTAVLLSVLVLREPLTPLSALGVALVLGATVVSELPEGAKKSAPEGGAGA